MKRMTKSADKRSAHLIDMTITADPAEVLWTVEGTAAYLGVPAATLYAWRSRGQGPRAYRVGRWLRYRREDVFAWLDEQAA